MKITKMSIVLLMIFYTLSFSQDDKTIKTKPYFTAIIVSDIDLSITWYSKVFDLELLNKVENEERGFKQANLASDNMLIELIEFSNTISKEDALNTLPEKSRLIGYFKIGFQVDDFDEWHNLLASMDIEFYGRTVKDSNSGKRTFIVFDPDGNYVQFFEQ